MKVSQITKADKFVIPAKKERNLASRNYRAGIQPGIAATLAAHCPPNSSHQ